MTGNKDDMEVDGRLDDGWQYRVKFDDGSVEHLRDHDAIAAVAARLGAAKIAAMSGTSKFEEVSVPFSGARAAEGPEGELGPVRGKGVVLAHKVVALAYTSTDGTEVPNQAYEAAVALLDIQRAALASLGQQVGTTAKAEADPNESLLG